MKIKYKFNKSSEARDCAVESVGLECFTTQKLNVTLEKVCEILNTHEKDKLDFSIQDADDIVWLIEDTRFTIINNKLLQEESYGNKHKIEAGYKFEDNLLLVIIEFIHQSGHGNFDCKLINAFIVNESIEAKSFTSQQELKNYINIIQEPIEFIAESSIDDVLMREWVGEWEKRKTFCKYCKQETFRLFCEHKGSVRLIEKTNECDIYSIQTGSPKLPSNWAFKIS